MLTTESAGPAQWRAPISRSGRRTKHASGCAKSAEGCNRVMGRSKPAMAVLAEELNRRLYEALQQTAVNAFGSVRQRVAVHLLDLASAQLHPRGRMVARVSQQELADAVGSVREVVARVLRDLRGAGIVATSSDSVQILDAARLHSESPEMELRDRRDSQDFRRARQSGNQIPPDTLRPEQERRGLRGDRLRASPSAGHAWADRALPGNDQLRAGGQGREDTASQQRGTRCLPGHAAACPSPNWHAPWRSPCGRDRATAGAKGPGRCRTRPLSLLWAAPARWPPAAARRSGTGSTVVAAGR